MKTKFFYFLFAFMAISAALEAKTVQLSFSGVTTEGRYCLLDSVKIENLTQNWEQTLDCSIDTTYELPVSQVPTGIDNVTVSKDGSGLLSVSQNLALGNTVISINPLDNGIVRMRVLDMVGHLVIEHAEYLAAGHHQYMLQLGTPQAYMISVVTNSEYASAKILNMTSSGKYDLSRITSLPGIFHSPLHRRARTEGEDLMQYIGYTNQKGAAVSSEPITQYQSSSEHVVLYFAPVAKSQEGMYVGMMGFNNDLFPYPFDILTASNLPTHQNFVSNLTMANGTILYHAVYASLNNIINAPVPTKLENVSIITFTDGLDIGSWRMNSDYPSEALYLAAVNKQIKRTYIDGIKLDAYAVGVKGSDVTDVARFENDLHQLASDSANVYSVSNMDEVNARFREIAAKIYNTNVNYSLTIKLPAPEPGSIIRFTFDNVTDANNSIYYIEGTYDYDFEAGMGILNNVTYSGITCSNGSTWASVPEGIFDVFTIHNISTNLGERISTSSMRQWSYIPSTNSWQINSEFDPSSNSSSTEERTSALVMLVLDCSSSLSSDFSQMQTAAKNFLSILAGKGNISKPIVSSVTVKLGDLQAKLSANIKNTGNLSIKDKGFCVSEYPNMDNAKFYSCGPGEANFEYLITDLIEGKIYYIRPYAENQHGRTYGEISSFTAIQASLPVVSLKSTYILDVDKILCTGEIVSDGNAPIIERGFCWSLTPNPTIDDHFIISETSDKTYKDTIKGLEPHTEIYIRAYAKNKKGIVYSSEASNTYISAIFYTASQKINLHSSGFNAGILYHNFKDGKGTIIFRQKISRIGESAFDTNKGMYSVTIPNSVTLIGDYAFRDCSDLASIEIPNSVTSIGSYAFSGCAALTTATIGNSVTAIGEQAFEKCTALTSITIPNSVTSIEKYTFWYCRNLKSVTIGDGVTNIREQAFFECTGLTSVTLGNSVISIESGAFRDCSDLASITIPNSVTSIGAMAFWNCTSLAAITCKATTPPTCGTNPFYNITKSIPVYVPATSVSAYKSASIWKSFTNIQAIRE